MDFRANPRPLRAGAIAALLAFTILLAASERARAVPTPASGTLSETDTLLTWAGGNIFGANTDESTCIEDQTCETFVLTLAPGDYTGLKIALGIDWLLPANDYDFYVHRDALDGPIVGQGGEGATNFEADSIDLDPAVVTEPIVLYFHVVAFAVGPGDNYSGYARFATALPPRTPVYLPGGLTFSQNVSLRCPATTSDGEPSVRIDERGNTYVGGIRGVPAGVDLWRFNLNPSSTLFDPGMQNPTYLGQPDAFLEQDGADTTAGGADGGGDIDIATSFPTGPDGHAVVTISSLAAANISTAVSFDRGETFTLSPATAIVPADDRQWQEATGDTRLYMMYRAPIPATGLFLTRSDDNGASFPLTTLISPTGSSPGYIDVDHNSGAIYASHQSGSALFVGRSTDEGVTWTNETVDNSTLHGNLFDPVKVDAAGNVYTVWSNGVDIFMAHSEDGGVTWSQKVRVNDNSVYRVNLLPWLEAGSEGRVAVVWYGTTSETNDNDADWDVLFSQTLDATAPNPTFRQQVVSDHIIHASNISLGGLNPTGEGENRNLIDYFQVALDPQGAAVIAYTDDHNDFFGNLYVTRQLDGTSLYADTNGGMVVPSTPPPLPAPDPTDPEVADFLHDAVAGLLQVVPTDSPYDILWVDYFCQDDTLIGATMKVSDLATIPPSSDWQMSFAANAPNGLAERGDQFFLRAETDAAGVATFSYGTAVREGDGAITYTVQGPADGGAFVSADSTITAYVSISKLNAFVTQGPPIQLEAKLLYGLRGRARTTGSGGGISDYTYGGTRLACGATGVPSSRPPAGDFLGHAAPNPMSSGSTVSFRIDRPGFVEMAVFDVTGRRVRTLHAGNLARGTYTRTWNGRTDRFSDAATGTYFFVLTTASGIRTEKVTLVR